MKPWFFIPIVLTRRQLAGSQPSAAAPCEDQDPGVGTTPTEDAETREEVDILVIRKARREVRRWAVGSRWVLERGWLQGAPKWKSALGSDMGRSHRGFHEARTWTLSSPGSPP